MTKKDFISWMVGYYGQIPEGQRADLVAYLDGLAPSYLDALKAAVARRFSSQYGRVPDIAIFEDCKAAALAGQREIQESRAVALLEAPAERGEGELMAFDWGKAFDRAAWQAKAARVER